MAGVRPVRRLLRRAGAVALTLLLVLAGVVFVLGVTMVGLMGGPR